MIALEFKRQLHIGLDKGKDLEQVFQKMLIS